MPTGAAPGATSKLEDKPGRSLHSPNHCPRSCPGFYIQGMDQVCCVIRQSRCQEDVTAENHIRRAKSPTRPGALEIFPYYDPLYLGFLGKHVGEISHFHPISFPQINEAIVQYKPCSAVVLKMDLNYMCIISHSQTPRFGSFYDVVALFLATVDFLLSPSTHSPLLSMVAL